MRVSALRMPLAAIPLAAITAGAIGTGCGSLDGHTTSPSVLASVQGQLSLNPDNLTAPDDVHIAIVWQANIPGHFNVAEDLPVQPVFPSQYVLQLTEPPPASVFSHNDGSVASVAYGVLVAYEDLNGDGVLDLVANDAGAFVDRVVATNPALAIFYIDSTTGVLPPIPSGTFFGTPTLGYNLMTQDCTPLDGSLMGPDGGYCDWNTFLPMSHPYDLPFSNDPTLNSLMCQTSPTGFSSVTGSLWNVDTEGPPPDGYPSPGAPGLACSADGATYTTQTCRTVPRNLCASEAVCADEQVVLGGAARPSDWPCP
jgi:hypothetical protein